MHTEYDDLLRQIEATEKLAKARPFGCKCPTMAIKLVGDGCDECNPEYLADMMEEDDDDDGHGYSDDHIPYQLRT